MNASATPFPALDVAPTFAGRRYLSTETVEPRRRSQYWMEMVCGVFVRLECQALGNMEMHGSIETSSIGSIDLTHLRATGQKVRRTASHIRNSGDDFMIVQIQRQGRCVVRQDERTAIATPGDFVLYDTVRPYELIFDDSVHDALILRLERSKLEPHVGRLGELTATTVGGAGPAGQMLASMLEVLHRGVENLHPASMHALSEAVASAVAAGLRSLPNANVTKTSNLAAYHIARVKAYVSQNLRDPNLSIASIAAAMQMTPDHLCRLFRAEPRPLSRMLWQQRLEACRRDLGDPRMARCGISEIAFSWGFNEAGHFSRCFREQFGVSPRDFRSSELKRAFCAADSSER
jgi:AraC-like DNA-binding protein